VQTYSTSKRSVLIRKVLPALAMGSLVFGVSACGGGSENAASTDSSTTSSSTSSSTTSTTAPKKPCTPTNLEAASAAEYPSSTVEDITCSAAFAVATLQSGRLAGGSGMAFFGTGPDGTWALLRVAPVTADPNADLPAGLPASLPNGWKSRYEARVNSPPTTSNQEYVNVPPPTATTAPPTTEPPPEEVPVEEPPAE
jgi:hypothetical protein